MAKNWKETEINFLKQNYAWTKDKELGRHLTRSTHSISYMAFKLRLKKDKEFYCQARRQLPFELTKGQLTQLYCVEKKAIRRIANELKIGKGTVDYYLEKYAINKRTKSQAQKEWYIKGGSVWCKGLSKTTDKRLLRMTQRVHSTWQKRRQEKIKELELKFGVSFPEILNDLYWNKKLTQEKIAKVIDWDRKFVIQWMRNYNIKLRPKYEYIQSLRGSKHPLYGVSWEQTYGIEGAKKRREFFRKFSRENIIKRIVNREFPFYNTNPELLLAEEMKKRNIIFVSQLNVDDTFVCDFAIPEAKLAIECDGDYWHANPRKYDRANPSKLHKIQRSNLYRDEVKDKYLVEKGWKVLRFFEYDIKQDVRKCVDKIEQASIALLKTG
ncbi:hypothetical protein J4208_04675 [Candidatus Woesearchaeota archaeon]|nr:hypothetical protein [Candidatus Woesearchaeota archaeon]